MGDEADADWQEGLVEWGREEALEDRLVQFLNLVKTNRWRSVPLVWGEQLRYAISERLIRVGWGGVIELTDAGKLATRS